jgi:hypothetical protein
LKTRSLIAALAAVLLATACSTSGVDVAQWTEEVRLSDQEDVHVERQARRHSSGFPAARRGSLIDEKLRVQGSDIAWSGSEPAMPVTLERVAGSLYLVVLIAREDDCRSRAPEPYSAQVYRGETGTWVKTPQAQAPLSELHANLFRGYWGYGTQSDAQRQVLRADKAIRFGGDEPVLTAYFHGISSAQCKPGPK